VEPLPVVVTPDGVASDDASAVVGDGAPLPDQVKSDGLTSDDASARLSSLLSDRRTLDHLRKFCLYHLGYGATAEDAKDALQDFCLQSGLAVAAGYKPGTQTLLAYFKFCLKRFCWGRGNQLRERARLQDSLDEPGRNGQRPLEFADESPDSDPFEKLLEDAEREKARSRVLAATDKLSREDREILHLQYELELPMREIATRLEISEEAAKVRAFRARARLRDRLEMKESAARVRGKRRLNDSRGPGE
jgi:RNA polymerase sigma factor (sigma-70 family)